MGFIGLMTLAAGVLAALVGISGWNLAMDSGPVRFWTDRIGRTTIRAMFSTVGAWLTLIGFSIAVTSLSRVVPSIRKTVEEPFVKIQYEATLRKEDRLGLSHAARQEIRRKYPSHEVVELTIVGVQLLDTARIVEVRLAGALPSDVTWCAICTKDIGRITLAPIRDIRALASRIDFGTVTIDGQSIWVTADPARTPTRSADEEPSLDLLIEDLGSPVRHRSQRALGRIAEMAPDDSRRRQVAAALAPISMSPDVGVKVTAVTALCSWGGPEDLPAFLGFLRDKDQSVRRPILVALLKFKDPRSVQAVAECLASDAAEAVKILVAIGAAAEDEVCKYLDHPEPNVRRSACRVLAEIGGPKSLDRLQTKLTDGVRSVQVHAEMAVSRIKARH